MFCCYLIFIRQVRHISDAYRNPMSDMANVLIIIVEHIIYCYNRSNTRTWVAEWRSGGNNSIIITTATKIRTQSKHEGRREKEKEGEQLLQNKCNIVLILRLTCNILMYFAMLLNTDRHKELWTCEHTHTCTKGHLTRLCVSVCVFRAKLPMDYMVKWEGYVFRISSSLFPTHFLFFSL